MKILKFGGTSIGTAERMREVATLISDNSNKVVVLSAMADVTNFLEDLISCYSNKDEAKINTRINKLESKFYHVIYELFTSSHLRQTAFCYVDSKFNYLRDLFQSKDDVNISKITLAQGEIITSMIFQLYLEEIGMKSVLIPALNFMRIDKDGEPDNFYIEESLKREMSQFRDTKIFITQGYICKNAIGEIDNLKRGGSDTTASLIGAALKANEIQIWTDIDGLHNNDPRFVENTYCVSQLSFEEAEELAYFGAKILHPLSILPAKISNIPVLLKDTTNPEAKGTIIKNHTSAGGIKAVASKDGITAVKIKSGRMLLAYGFLKKVFEIFEEYKTPVDMITTSEVSVSVTIDNTKNLKQIVNDLEKYGTVEIHEDQSLVCVVGDLLAERKGIASKILNSLEDIPIRMISYGASHNNISLLINSSFKRRALNLLNDNLFRKTKKSKKYANNLHPAYPGLPNS